jgi:sec-independent protein translocase protein TatA
MKEFIMFGRLGWAEILIIVVLVVVLFGHNKIPTMMKNLANGLNVFKKEMKADKKSQEKKKTVKKK